MYTEINISEGLFLTAPKNREAFPNRTFCYNKFYIKKCIWDQVIFVYVVVVVMFNIFIVVVVAVAAVGVITFGCNSGGGSCVKGCMVFR